MSPQPEPTNLVTVDRPETADIATVRPLPWWQMILVRVARTYLMSVLGLLGAGASGQLAPLAPTGFYATLVTAALTSIGPAVVCLIWNATEILAQLDIRKPELRA